MAKQHSGNYLHSVLYTANPSCSITFDKTLQNEISDSFPGDSHFTTPSMATELVVVLLLTKHFKMKSLIAFLVIAINGH